MAATVRGSKTGGATGVARNKSPASAQQQPVLANPAVAVIGDLRITTDCYADSESEEEREMVAQVPKKILRKVRFILFKYVHI